MKKIQGKIRLGVVGLGHRGRVLFEMIGKSENVQCVAACDVKRDLWFAPYRNDGILADRMKNVTFYEDFEKMLKESSLDVLLVETPAYCHAEFCALAMQYGVNIYSDIPSVASLEEAEMLWQAQKANPVLFMTGATTLGWGFAIALQDIYKKGLLGKISSMETEYVHDIRALWKETPWRKPTKEANSLLHPISYCTHGLGVLLAVLEEELRSVSAFSSGSHVTELEDANDYECAIYQTPSGVIIRQTNSFINNWKGGNHSFRVFGSEGVFEHLAARGERKEETSFSSEKMYGAKSLTFLPISFAPHDQKLSFGHGGADSYLWFAFEKALLAGAETAPVDLKKGLQMTLPGIFAVRSIENGGRKMAIHYPWDEDWKEFLAGDNCKE